MRELRNGPPRGHLRICSTTSFGRAIVAPLMRGFNDAFPEITVELLLNDHPANFTVDRIDVSFRDGHVEDSQVIGKQLIPMQLLVCASPEYARMHGLPRDWSELSAHRCINLRTASGRIAEWEFSVEGRTQKLVPPGRHTFNCAELALQAVHAGQGLAQLASYQVCDSLRAGRLVTCLTQFSPNNRGHYLCYLTRKHLPSRIRVFVDYITQQVRALDLDCPTEALQREVAD
jgi:DNA-binding transcriptional LysR family regulator